MVLFIASITYWATSEGKQYFWVSLNPMLMCCSVFSLISVRKRLWIPVFSWVRQWKSVNLPTSIKGLISLIGSITFTESMSFFHSHVLLELKNNNTGIQSIPPTLSVDLDRKSCSLKTVIFVKVYVSGITNYKSCIVLFLLKNSKTKGLCITV